MFAARCVPYVDDEIFYSLCLRLFLTTGAHRLFAEKLSRWQKFEWKKKIPRRLMRINQENIIMMAMTLKTRPRAVMAVISLQTHDYIH